MGANSKIEWTDHTFNAWTGCEKVSPACAHCYAEVATPVRVARSKGLELWGGDVPRKAASEDTWKEPARWDELSRRGLEAWELHVELCRQTGRDPMAEWQKRAGDEPAPGGQTPLQPSR